MLTLLDMLHLRMELFFAWLKTEYKKRWPMRLPVALVTDLLKYRICIMAGEAV